MVEFDYVCDMVRMFTNQQNRRKSSFIQQKAIAVGAEPSLEEIMVDEIQVKSSQTQTSGELWTQANLSYTPKEKELIDKL